VKVVSPERIFTSNDMRDEYQLFKISVPKKLIITIHKKFDNFSLEELEKLESQSEFVGVRCFMMLKVNGNTLFSVI
jgi:hypothetical protein